MNLLVATVWTKPEPCLLEASCMDHGVPLLVTQRGEPWQDIFTNKVVRFWPIVDRLDWDAILFIDGHDGFITTPSVVGDTLGLLWDSRTRLLVSGERNCFPWPERHRAGFPDGVYPNAGVWAGYRKPVEEFFEWVLSNPLRGYAEDVWTATNCDQQYWCEAAMHGLVEIGPQAWCTNLYGMTDEEVASVHYPLIVHGSGPQYKTKVIDLYRKMGGQRR